jgi:hypothetical protein
MAGRGIGWPFSYKVYADEHLIVSRSFGIATLEDMSKAFSGIASDIEGWPGVTAIADLRQVEASTFSALEIRSLAELMAGILRQSGARMRTILIAGSDQAFGLARAYCAQAAYEGREEATVVRCPDEAAKWIGITSERMAALLKA